MKADTIYTVFEIHLFKAKERKTGAIEVNSNIQKASTNYPEYSNPFHRETWLNDTLHFECTGKIQGELQHIQLNKFATDQ